MTTQPNSLLTLRRRAHNRHYVRSLATPNSAHKCRYVRVHQIESTKPLMAERVEEAACESPISPGLWCLSSRWVIRSEWRSFRFGIRGVRRRQTVEDYGPRVFFRRLVDLHLQESALGLGSDLVY